MKKSLLALAVLAAFGGAASAQSSITLYGRAEANVTYSTPGDGINRGDSVWKMNDGGATSGIGGSRWGLRGSEDLGNGLRAYFVLEAPFNIDSGDQNNSNTGAISQSNPTQTSTPYFQRQAYVALGSATLGDIRLGRQETLSRLVNSGYADVSAIGELKIDEGVLSPAAAAPPAAGLVNGGYRTVQLFQTFGQRVDNAVGYTTPNFGGFQARALVAAGEATTARYQGVMASYTGGPVAVAVSFEEYNKFGVFTKAYNKTAKVGGNYNFGFASIFAGYENVKDVGGNYVSGAAGFTRSPIKDQQDYTVGLLVPFGSFQFRANYTKANYDLYVPLSGSTSYDVEKYGVSVRYVLSKRTTLYSAYTERAGSGSTGDATGGAAARFNDNFFLQKREVTLLGLAHTF